MFDFWEDVGCSSSDSQHIRGLESLSNAATNQIYIGEEKMEGFSQFLKVMG